MSTLRDFSQALYDFHGDKVGFESRKYHSIESLCSVAARFFVDELRKVDVNEFAATRLPGKKSSEKKSKLLAWLQQKICEINDCVKRESENDILASLALYNVLFDKTTPRYKYTTSQVASHTDFYRVRKGEKYNLYDKKGMFIIPDDKENLVASGRFNQSGYACLYLASNLYLAWEETRRPNFDELNFSRFQNIRKVEVLDLTLRKSYKFQGHFLMAYLSLLCGAKTNENDNHNYQYVVPQMMMKVLCHHQKKYEALYHTKNSIAGIKYMSSRRYDQKDLLFNDWRLTIDYVFPQHPHDTISICPYLAGLFRLTDPRTYFFFKARGYDFQTRKAKVSDYEDSLFYQLEEEMKNCVLKKYDED